jgi:hypothetical protein
MFLFDIKIPPVFLFGKLFFFDSDAAHFYGMPSSVCQGISGGAY